ncbi:hypothetical protein D3C78_1429170 [compost metagenome]
MSAAGEELLDPLRYCTNQEVTDYTGDPHHGDCEGNGGIGTSRVALCKQCHDRWVDGRYADAS